MNLTEDEAPKLSKLPFIAADVALLAAAFAIAYRGGDPLGTGAIIAICACVIVGAGILVIPFMIDYARRADAAIADRQNQIAALARVTSDSAEQLGIVAAGLNGISESSKHSLSSLEQLPSQLKTRVEEAVRQLSAAAQSAQTSVKDDIARLEKASKELSSVAAKASESLHAAAKSASAKDDALAVSETKLSESLARVTKEIDSFVASATKAAEATAKAAAKAEASAKSKSAPKETPPAPKEAVTPPPAPVDEPPAPQPVATAEAAPAAPEPAPAVAEPAPPAPVAAEPVVSPEPPAPVIAKVDVTHTEEPATPSEPDAADVPVDEPPAPKPPRARKPKPADDIADLGLVPDASESESSITSDGFTRLIATAYIGIGNKLFIRGEGPGLSWDKGIPLQFVSIGKWRWETPDATASVKAKLYKNDQVECVGLGQLVLEPGRQHEVNAGF